MKWNLKSIFLLPVLAIALMGQACPDQDAQVRSALASWCPAVDVADAHYEAIRTRISVNTQRRVDAVVDNFQMICAGRTTATTITILAQASLAFDAISDALREARANDGSAVGYQGHINALESLLEKARRR